MPQGKGTYGSKIGRPPKKMKKGGQGYIDRKDESVAMRIQKPRTKKTIAASLGISAIHRLLPGPTNK